MNFDRLFQDLNSGDASLAVVGLGYVGLPLAVHLGRRFNTIGFDINKNRVDNLVLGNDDTGEVSPSDLKSSKLRFTADPNRLREASVFIVAVPTPIDEARIPDLRPLKAASETVGDHMGKGAVVVFESTVYPGVTEDICGPILERRSGGTSGVDFFLGYSPERINPGDKEHRFEKIVKVVSGQTPEVLALLDRIYGSVVEAGIHKAPDIKTAEAAKVIENTQRDLNIALMNELAVIFNTLGIDTKAVLAAAGTKWNFLNFTPGLVGGHCIGVDPYYLTYLAQKFGHHPEVILSGREINDGMGKFIAEQTIKRMIKAGLQVAGSRVLVLGLTFKEDVSDLRNSKVFDVIRELREYDVEVLVHDPNVANESLQQHYGETITPLTEDLKLDGVILAVGHQQYRSMGNDLGRFVNDKGVLIDIKGLLPNQTITRFGARYWRL